MARATLDEPLTLPDLVGGQEITVPLLGGAAVRPINLDHAASTPALRSVRATVDHFLNWYSSVHRGTGFCSQLCTQAYEEARGVVAGFVGARPDQHVIIFGANTTWALNKLARRFPFRRGDVVVSTELEHHANDLPWRQVAQVVHARVDSQGRLDEDHVAQLLRRHAGKVRLLAVTGGSNVTGTLPRIHHLAELAHAAGAEIVVDCAQLAPHRPIDLGDLDDPAHLDYIAFSGHKLYAPFGSGVLIGRRDTFARSAPDTVGGGTVRRVTAAEVEWADTPARDEPGTPNVVGAVALAAAVLDLQRAGLDKIAAHEAGLTAVALERLHEVPGLRLYGDSDPTRAGARLGVIPFALAGFDHRLVAAILSCEYGIAVRSGAFCAQPYVRRLLGAENAEPNCGGAAKVGGLIRVSFGLANTHDDVDTLADALHTIAQREYRGTYHFDEVEGSYRPGGWRPTFPDVFRFSRGEAAARSFV
ncbi:MAG: aminotransferase class V-fold PLP-dependent enzyme [Chloroflexota bacterium]|nr:aminotransferase class V-fold PLP-dependent enzyme [Chloroflexota bacterium]